MSAELVIRFRELFPDKPRSAIQLFPVLNVPRDTGEISVELSGDDGIVLMTKPEFRALAHMAEDVPIGRGRLVFPFATGAPVYVVPE